MEKDEQKSASEDVPPKADKEGDKKETQQGGTRNRTIAQVVDSYTGTMEALHTSLPMHMHFLISVQKKTREKFNTLKKEHGRVIREDNETQDIVFPVQFGPEAERLSEQLTNLNKARKVVPKTFVLSLVSQYDAFLGQLIGAIFYLRPEILKSSDKKLSFAELVEFGSIDAAREFLIEKEIDGVLRESHSKQFAWMENKFNLPLREGLENWPLFIEVTERRNLFTHTDGVVSNQYLEVCKQHKVLIPKDAVPGAVLGVTREYFENAYNVLFEIGVKLAHVLWRKLLPQDRKKADGKLSDTGYILIKKKQYKLAQTILDFATSFKEYSSDRTRRVMIINRAQAYKFGGQAEDCLRILDSEDWSSCGKDFDLCVRVLREEFDAAADTMRQIRDEIRQQYYIDWPVFQAFRETEQFRKAYKEIFGEDFVLQTTKPSGSDSQAEGATDSAALPPGENGKLKNGETAIETIGDTDILSTTSAEPVE